MGFPRLLHGIMDKVYFGKKGRSIVLINPTKLDSNVPWYNSLFYRIDSGNRRICMSEVVFYCKHDVAYLG